MIPASMSVDGEHATTYRQQHGSPNIFFHWIKFFLQKIYKGNVLVTRVLTEQKAYEV